MNQVSFIKETDRLFCCKSDVQAILFTIYFACNRDLLQNTLNFFDMHRQ